MTIRQLATLLATGVEFNISRLATLYASGALAVAVILLALWYVLLLPPSSFPAGKIITIQEGQTTSAVALKLEEAGVIRSARVFVVLARLMGDTSGAKAGKYVFARPVGVYRIEERVTDGAYGIVATRVTFLEGTTVRQMGRTLKQALPDFDEDAFLAKAIPLEGFLFPDTYQFYPDVTADDVIVKLYENFTEHIATIQDDLDAYDRPLRDDLIMASLLEKEARSLDEKRMVAGILWNRIARGMPLQVDAVFGYINDRDTYSPKFSELDTDSDYNTYIHTGLPPGPIGNPGINSLLAAVTPTKTTALFYLTGHDGEMHYANTFAEHKINRARYLN